MVASPGEDLASGQGHRWLVRLHFITQDQAIKDDLALKHGAGCRAAKQIGWDGPDAPDSAFKKLSPAPWTT